jgi:predicted ATPase
VIRRLQIDNFKSLVGFSLLPASRSLSRFTCLIGKNEAGKSTVLQAIDFLAQLAKGTTAEWLRSRGWLAEDLASKLTTADGSLISIEVEIELDLTRPMVWTCKFDSRQSYVSEESIRQDGRELLRAKDGTVEFWRGIRPWEDESEWQRNSGLRYSGSALSILKDEDLPHPLRALKQAFSRSLFNFELVSSFHLKEDSLPSREIGVRGENLGGYLHELDEEARERAYTRMKGMFPNTTAIQRRDTPQKPVIKMSSFDRFIRYEQHKDGIPSQHFSDGFVRLLAVFAQIEGAKTPDTVLLLDEIEDGIHPELVAKLVRHLTESGIQIFATTHSPLVLNYLSDTQARESAVFLYRNALGETHASRYFDLPSTRKKLGILGPGEVYVDTSVEKLTLEAEEMEQSTTTEAGATGQ